MKKLEIFLVYTGLSILIVFLVGFTFFKKAKLEGLKENAAWIGSTERIFFLKSDGGIKGCLYSIQLNGQNPVKLADGPISYYLIAPDGKKIAYLKAGDKNPAGYVDLNSKKNFIISSDCDSIDWSPFSDRIVYVSNKKIIHIYSLSDVTSKEVISINKDIIVGPRWSRDGRKLYFNTLSSHNYYEIDVESGTMKELGSRSMPSSGKAMVKKKKWEDYLELSKMHFNQSSTTVLTWKTRISPSKSKQLSIENGSLILMEGDKKKKELIVENVGGYNPDIGHSGFINPVWTRDEKHVLGRFYDSIIIVDLSSRTAGILTEGYAPLAYLPGYYPVRIVTTPMNYSFIE